MEPLEQREQIFIQYKKWLYYLGNPRPIFLCLCVGCVILSIRSTHLSPRPSFHRRFVWEHFQDLNHVVQHMKYSGGTFSGYKSFLCRSEITVLGHRCTYEGRLPDQSRVSKIIKWGPCTDLTDVRAFLGTIRVCRLFIRNFSHRAHHLIKLTCKGTEWVFGPDQLSAMSDLKEAVLSSPALHPIDYESSSPVILSVDTSHIAVGYILSQCSADNPRLRYHARFGSITLTTMNAGSHNQNWNCTVFIVRYDNSKCT